MTDAPSARRSGRDDLVRREASHNFEMAQNGGGGVVLLAYLAACLWLAGLAAAFLGLGGASLLSQYPPPVIAAVGLVSFVPALLIVSAGYMARANRRAAAANALVLEAAARLMAPAREAGSEGITFAEQMKQSAAEIDRAMAHALSAMKAMAGEIGDERLRLESVSYAASENARDLSARLAEERQTLEALAHDLRAQVTEMNEAIPRQAQLMISAARSASDEVSRADTALEARLTAMQEAGENLARKLEELDNLAREAAGRTEELTFSVSRVEDKLEESRRTVDAAVRASEVAAAAAATTGDALKDAVSSALDGARNANNEIHAATRAAAEEAARSLTRLRETGEQAAYALRAAGLAARSENEALDRLAGPYMPAGSAAASAPMTPPAITARPSLSPPPAPPPQQPFQNGPSQSRPLPVALPPAAQIAARQNMDDELFEASADAVISASSRLSAEREQTAEISPSPSSEPPTVHTRSPVPPVSSDSPPVNLRRRHDDPPADTPVRPSETPRRRASDFGLTSPPPPPPPASTSVVPTTGPAPWREIISDISKDQAPLVADREAVAEGVIERLQSSGIPLADVFRPKAKRRIAEANNLGDEDRRAAIIEQGGKQFDRVVLRLRGDPRLGEMARQFIAFERTDALAALEQTQSTGRNASPRLAAFLLLDAAL